MNTSAEPSDPEAARNYFGTTITPVTFSQWLDAIEARIVSGDRHYLSGSHNLHSLYLAQTDPVMVDFYHRCNECYIDGMAVRLSVAAAGIATTAEQRFSLMDKFPQLLERAARCAWTVVYVGSRQEVVDQASERLNRDFPGLGISLYNGYFVDEEQLIETINRLRPDLLLVGMGMPRQEQWLLTHLDDLDVAVAIQAGATLDYFAGAQAKPPSWVSDAGLAWLYRLAHDPRRLWRRYLLEPWALLLPTLKLWSRR